MDPLLRAWRQFIGFLGANPGVAAQFLFGLCLAVGLLGAASIAANAIDQAKRYPNEVVDVTGSAVKQVASDEAQWTTSFTRQGASIQDIYHAMKADETQLRRFLETEQVKPAEMAFGSVATNTLYTRDHNGNTTNTIEGYSLTQTVVVKSTDVDKIQRIVQGAARLMDDGVVLSSTAPEYYYTQLDSLKVSMLGLATQNAADRAKSMARSTGRGIGRLRNAHMGVFQITGANSNEVSDYGINDTSARTKKVTAVVNAAFELN